MLALIAIPIIMKLSHVLSRNPSSDNVYRLRKHTPWIASPLEKQVDSNGSSGTTTPEHVSHAAKHDATNTRQGSQHGPHFKHHRESSTIELFYDLFFVANLATFTANHEIVSADSLKNYIGFFTILWFTWLETSLFDVRFATDSVFNRIAKAVSFGVMTGFAVTGAIYDTTAVSENVKAFRALSLILMVSRLALVVQYAVVLWYTRQFKGTFLPLILTMTTYFISAIVYLVSLSVEALSCCHHSILLGHLLGLRRQCHRKFISYPTRRPTDLHCILCACMLRSAVGGCHFLYLANRLIQAYTSR
jgi:hypothetical protein